MKLPSKSTVINALLLFVILGLVSWTAVQAARAIGSHPNRAAILFKTEASALVKIATPLYESRDVASDTDTITYRVQDTQQDLIVKCDSGTAECKVVANLRPQPEQKADHGEFVDKKANTPAPAAPAPTTAATPDAGTSK